jgi:hypothetical protein
MLQSEIADLHLDVFLCVKHGENPKKIFFLKGDVYTQNTNIRAGLTLAEVQGPGA